MEQASKQSGRLTLALLKWSWRSVVWLLVAAYFLIAVSVLGLRHWLLPKVPEYRQSIERVLSESIGARVTIGRIAAGWSTFHPTLDIGEVKVFDQGDQVAFSLGHVAAEVSWRGLLARELRFHSIQIDKPVLKIQRSREGKLFIAGIEMKTSPKHDSPNLGDWVLHQGEVVISGGEIDWLDELRGAPQLALTEVDFRLINTITGDHRFALKAAPPKDLAATIDVRGQFRGDSMSLLDRLRGQLYAQLEYADLVGWKSWVDYPFTVSSGRGSLRLWATLEEGKIIDATADVALADVKARVAADLPELQLSSVEGRVGAREVRKGAGFFGFLTGRTFGYSVFGEQIALTGAAGRAQPPANFTLQWERREEGGLTASAREPQERGEFKANVVEAGPLLDLVEAVPVPAAIRKFVRTHDPRGTLTDVAASWTGEIAAPETFTARARLSGFAFVEGEGLPGVSGLAGSIEATQRGGSITLAGNAVRFAYPNVLPWTKQLDFDAFDAQINWSQVAADSGPRWEVRVPTLNLANKEVSLTGTIAWHALPNSPGFLDLDIRIPRAEPKAIYKYVPKLHEVPAGWLRQAFLAGTASDGQVRIRGDIFHFPFVEHKDGTFSVSAKANGVTLRYLPEWPVFEQVDGEFKLNGLAMDIKSDNARLYGARLSQVSVRSPDVDADDVTLDINGQAEGATGDLFRFLLESPLNREVGPAIRPLKAVGRGKLALQLSVPLKRARQSKLTGVYEFVGNELAFGPSAPPLTQLAGKLEFNERGIDGKGFNAQFLGGPVQFDLTSRGEAGLMIDAKGTVQLAEVKKAYPFPFDAFFEGTTAYTASVRSGNETFALTVDAPLQGTRIDLPAPFGKSAAASLPFKLERSAPEGVDRKPQDERDTLAVSLGSLVNVQARMRRDGDISTLDRAAVSIGDAKVALPGKAELGIGARLASLDLDRVLPVLRKFGDAPAAPGGAKPLPIAPVAMQVADLTVMGRRLKDANLQVTMEKDGWSARVNAQELEGSIDWVAHGAGSVRGRFKRLTLPELVEAPPGVEKDVLKELPALDIIAESFVAHGKDFGKLELKASDRPDGWHINQLVLAMPDGSIRADGLWQLPDRGNRTDVNVLLDTKDIGKFLARMGQGEAVNGGAAKLSGKISWNGPPTGIDYPTLNGSLSLNAEHGRFLKADPGFGRLLGVLSLQTLPRRMSLDFRDVFSEGFVFDEITATASVAKGIMTTRDFRMVGPAAGVGMAGDIDLDRETQNLRVRVVPVVGDSVAAVAALALLNPLVGLGTLIAQRVLKDPLGQILAYEYVVKGAWSDPQVERAARQDVGPSDRNPMDQSGGN